MNLTFKAFDGRSFNHVDVVDEETGNKVGYIRSNGVGNFGGIYVSLFGERYRAQLNRYDECTGFVRRVEAVLNHITSTKLLNSPRGYEIPVSEDTEAA